MKKFKEWLRSWFIGFLNVHPKDTLTLIVAREVKDQVAHKFRTPDVATHFNGSYYLKGDTALGTMVRNTVRECAGDIIEKETRRLTNVIDQKLCDQIHGDKILDTLVERLRKKQLP